MNYLSYKEITIDPSVSPEKITELYHQGFVFTRIGKGVMQQTRSVRIDLTKFKPSSENRRILKKMEEAGITLTSIKLPLPDYSWTIGKLAKDFYDTKFATGIMSAQKVKEMLTDETKSNFTHLLSYGSGYCITYMNGSTVHYSYPFYDLASESTPKDMGLGMMTLATMWAKENDLSHIYLGSLQRPTDTYKLQFEGLEWFDASAGVHGEWKSDTEEVKNILRQG